MARKKKKTKKKDPTFLDRYQRGDFVIKEEARRRPKPQKGDGAIRG